MPDHTPDSTVPPTPTTASASSTALNRAAWDERAPVHAASPDYAVDRFVDDPAHLSGVVRFDLPRLGDLRGVVGVHLQCHIGTDTISLARLGATMTGLDFSSAAIEQARRLSERCGTPATFVEAELEDAVEHLGHDRFDLVFTGIGALCWLPSIERWADVVRALLRPGGRLFLRESHPMLWALADARDDGLLVVEYPYFETAEPTVWDEGGTYVETDHVFTETISHEWNHGLGELLTALLSRGFVITGFEEHDSAPWDAMPGLTVRGELGEFRLAERPERLPMTYTLQAVLP